MRDKVRRSAEIECPCLVLPAKLGSQSSSLHYQFLPMSRFTKNVANFFEAKKLSDRQASLQ